jgi:hypothetical protein
VCEVGWGWGGITVPGGVLYCGGGVFETVRGWGGGVGVGEGGHIAPGGGGGVVL